MAIPLRSMLDKIYPGWQIDLKCPETRSDVEAARIVTQCRRNRIHVDIGTILTLLEETTHD